MRMVEIIFGTMLTAAIVYQVLNAPNTSQVISSFASGYAKMTSALMGKYSGF